VRQDASDTQDSRFTGLGLSTAEPKRRIRTGPKAIVGRNQELVRLYAAIKRCSLGTGSSWLVSGTGGIGKTRLLHEVQRLSVALGFGVRWGYCVRGIETPLFPVLQLARVPLAHPDRIPKSATRKESLAHKQTGEILLLVLNELEKEAAGQPLLLLIDDLQWVDDESVKALNLLARMTSRNPILLVMATRRPYPERGSLPVESALDETLAHLRQEGTLEEIRLKPLKKTEVGELVTSLLPSLSDRNRTERVVEWAVHLSGGNPYLVIECARQLGEDTGSQEDAFGLEAPAGTGHRAGSEDPAARFGGGVGRLLSARLQGLTVREETLLRLASVVGEKFDEEPLIGVLRWPKREVRRRLRRLCDEVGVIVQLSTTPDRFSFEHALLWEYVLERVSESHYQEYSEQLGAWWEDHRPEEVETIARLFRESGKPWRALEAIRQALRLAARQRSLSLITSHLAWEREIARSHTDALRSVVNDHFEWGIWLLEEWSNEALRAMEGVKTLKLAASERRNADILQAYPLIRSNLPEAERRCAAMVRDLEGVDPRELTVIGPRLAVLQATIHAFQNRPQGEDWLVRAIHAATSGSITGYEICRAFQAAAATAVQQRHYARARRHLERGRAWARRLGLSHRPIGLVFEDLRGIVLQLEGHLSAATRLNARQYRAYAALGNLELASFSGTNLATSLVDLQDWDRAWDIATESMHLSERLDIPSCIGNCEYAQASVLAHYGDWKKALIGFRSAASMQLTRGMPAYAAVGKIAEVECLAELGQRAVAWEEARRLEANMEEIWPVFWPLVFRLQARLHELDGAKREAAAARIHALELARLYGEPATHMRLLAEVIEKDLKGGSPKTYHARKRELARLAQRAGVDPVRYLKSASNDDDLEARVPMVRLGDRSNDRATRSSGQSVEKRLPERILLYLSRLVEQYPDAETRREVPIDFTQAGIATGIGVPRASFAQALSRLTARDLVLARSRRVTGQLRSRKAYFLSERGRELARSRFWEKGRVRVGVT
jgi:AAA ATPase domain